MATETMEPVSEDEAERRLLRRANAEGWPGYEEDTDISANLAADKLTELAQEVAETRKIPYGVALAMIYQIAAQRIDWGEIDEETGEAPGD